MWILQYPLWSGACVFFLHQCWGRMIKDAFFQQDQLMIIILFCVLHRDIMLFADTCQVSWGSGLFGQDYLCCFLNFISLLCCLHEWLLMISTMPQHQILSKPTKLSIRKTSANLCSTGIFPDKGRCWVHLLPPTKCVLSSKEVEVSFTYDQFRSSLLYCLSRDFRLRWLSDKLVKWLC